MNNKKILSIITLAGVIGMNAQPIATNIQQSDNTVLLANRNLNTNNQNKITSLKDNIITINNVWNQNIGTLKFNPVTSKIEFTKGWAETNPYASKTEKFFSISLYKSNGELIKSVQVDGHESPEEELYNAFNNLDYSYGDIIEINYQNRSSKISISNFNNQKSYQVTKPISMEITKDGLKELSNNLTVNPIYYELNSNKVEVSGKTKADTLVNVWIDGKDYTATSSSNGEYKLNISADENITQATEIRVFVEGENDKVLNPILNPNVYKIQNSAITINNGWGSPAGKITFNPVTMKMDISGYNLYLGHNSNKFLTLGIYDEETGKEISSQSFNGNDNTHVLAKYINNKSFKYGQIIGISYDSSQGRVSVIDNSKNIGNTSGQTEYFEITQEGLKELHNNLTVNPIYYELNSNKVEVSGKTKANTLVNVWTDGKDYTTTSDSNGEYKLNITANENITQATEIRVFVEGEGAKALNPILNPNIYKIENNIITINDYWNYSIGTLKFNPVTSKIEFNNGGQFTDTYTSKDTELFAINLYKSNGQLIKNIQINGDDYAAGRELYNVFNNLDYSYGDIIKIDYKQTSKISISNFDNQKSYQVTKPIQAVITQDGLKPSNMRNIEVNPFEVLGNGKVTSGVISGKVDKSNQEVNVVVDGKTFSGKSNDNGEFNISISDANGFTASTKIVVETDGELATIINPTANSKLGILKSNILIHGEDGVIAQEVSFNPATMTVVKSAPWGNNFPAQLISGKTGDVIASCGTTDFSVYTSKDNLNGAHFEYGDIIAVYETEQARLTNGSLLLLNGKTGIDCVDCFKYFRITPNGLVPVENKNLTTSQILYKGTNNMTLTGKTLPNTDVTVTYGNVSKVVKSNSNGEFSLEIPFSDAQIGTEVRVFVNSYNAEALIVKYDSKLININTNRIEVLNNTNLPIFNISFDPLTNKLSAIRYPGGMTYTGVFFENALKIKVINPKNGELIYSFNGEKLNDISNFVANINNKSYNIGDIIEVSYNPKFVKANVYDNKKMIGNTDGSKEYFEITNKGLVNLNDKFVNIKPLDILSNTKVTSTNIEGTAKPNTSVEVSVDGNIFRGMTNGNGNFNIAISDKNGFTSNTNIVVSSDGYIPTHINPTMESNIELMNNYINFYSSQGKAGSLVSSVGFNPQTMKFIVNNYTNSFGDGKSHYFNFDLYNSNGDKILSSSINNGATSQLTEALNDKSFNYGDIIGLSYNKDISKPAILNGNQVLGNISGKEEYFKITKEGLVKVNFGQNAYTSNVSWDNNNLVIDSNLADGQSKNVLSADKKLVILDSNNKIVDSVNTSILNNDQSSVQGVISESSLDKLNKDETYTFALDINNKLFPIKVTSNTPSNSEYVLEANSDNVLSVAVAKKRMVTINSSSEISSYLNTLNSDIKSAINVNDNINILTDSELNYKITANEFITRVGAGNLENFFNKSQVNKEFINWLLNNKVAMQDYLEGINQTGVNVRALQIWSDIWSKYTNSRSGFNLKLAIATAISNATPIMAWPSTHYYGYGDKVTVGSPVERYNIFETLNADGGMLPMFKTLDVKHIEYVVGTHIANSQILQLRDIVIQNHNGYINGTNSGINNIAYTIDYEQHNPHTGQSVDANSDFYGPHPNMEDIWYDGGVCYSIAMLGAGVCQVFGIPAQAVTQDSGGHKVFLFYNNDHEWNIGNNIFGLSKTFGGDISGWSDGIATGPNTANYNWLYAKANTPALKESNEYLWLANSDISYQDKMNAINEAIKIQPLNLRAWLDKIALMKTNNNLTAQDYINLANGIINTFKDYPMPMFDALLQIKDLILNDGTQQEYNKYIKAIDNALNSVTNSNQEPIAKNMLKLMPTEGLEDGATPLAVSKITINNVWNYSLATLGFNTIDMKMTVNKGWSIVNWYLNGEAFSIGLYNKNNELIKNVVIKGNGDGSKNEVYPENEIYNAFNNLGFKYGDKIFIDYKTSSKISASRLYKDGVLEKSYDVNKPGVFELTSRGLVYLGDSLEDSSENTTLKISTVYPDGKAVAGDKYNYTETGNIGDSIKNESIPALENYHVDYVTVNGVKTDINQLPKYYVANNINIVYHMASDSEYKLNINVKTEDGKVLSAMPKASYAKGDKISVADNNWDKKEYKLDYILVDGVKTPADKLPEVMPDKNLNITYVVSPIAKSTITVETMVDGKVIGKPVVTTNYQGEAYKEVAPTWDNNDYELKDITVNGVKTSEADVPKVFGDKDITIVYNLSPKMMNVGERVLNQNGDVLYNKEYKLPFNTSIVNIEDKIPSNYRLENITVSNPNNKEATLIANKNMDIYTNSNEVKVAFNGEVVSYNVVPINGEISYETQIGNEAPTNIVKEVGQVDTKSKEYKLDIPKGYKVESITVNGKKVDSVNDLEYNNEKQVVVYHLTKISTAKPVVDHNTENKPSADKHDSKPVIKPSGEHGTGNTENKPSIDNHEGTKTTPAKVEHGEVIVKVIDQNGKVVEEATHNGVVGLKFNPISIPSKDKLVNVTVNGNTVSANNVKNEIVSNPDTDNKTTIIYNVDIPENNNQGNTVDANGKSDINNTIDSDKNNSTNTPDNVSPTTNSNKNNSSISNKKDVTEDGNVKIEVIADNGRVVYSTDSNEKVGSEIESVKIPSGYHIDNVTSTVNNVNVNTVPTKVVKGDTVIIYHVSKIRQTKPQPTKVEKGTVREEIITNDGKVLLDSKYNEPVGSKINKVVIPNGYKLQSVSTTVNGNKVQEVPTKVEDGKTTIIYNVVSDKPVVNHNENNTDKHNDIKPVVNHNENNTDKHNDIKPVVNHNENKSDKHDDVKPVVNHNEDNTDKHDNVKPVVNHNENKTDKHDDVKPVVSHNEDNTDNHNDINPVVTNSNGNSESTIKGDNGETVTKAGLPDTGLNNAENELGLLAGIMAAIAAIGIFRRKK